MAQHAQRGTKKGRGGAEDIRQRVRRREQEGVEWNRVVAFLWRLMGRHPVALALASLFSVVIALAEVFSLSLLVPFLDILEGGGVGEATGKTQLDFLVVIFAGLSVVEQVRLIGFLFLAGQIVSASSNYLLARVTQYIHIKVGQDLRQIIFDDLMAAELRFIHRERTANLFTILHSFPTAASKIVDQFILAVKNSTSFLATLVLLFLVSPSLLVLAAALAFVVTMVTLQLSKVVRRRAHDIKDARLDMHRITLEALQGIKLIQLFGRVSDTRRRYRKRLEDLQDSQYRQATISAVVAPLYLVLSTSLFVAVLIGGTFILDRTDDDWITILGAFLGIMIRFMARSGNFTKRRTKIAAELPEMEAVLEFLERPDKTYLKDGTVEAGTLRDGVRFEDVRFRYAASDPEVIKGVSFEIPRGKMVAIVGASGAGKSTIIDLLARLYDPDSGRIVADGRDVRELNILTWRRRIAVVSQDTFLFNQSVSDNIRFGRLDATDDEIRRAAVQANADGFIRELPQGYDTLLGDRGVRLSGGQRQRIAIARAILADPDILVLDEATSALDTATEREVQAALERVSRDRTIVAIAHRLSTIRRADNILVLEKGEVAESGTHDALVARRGHYWRYVQMQDIQGDTQEAFLFADEPVETLVNLEAVLRARPSSLLSELGDRSAGASVLGEDAQLVTLTLDGDAKRLGDVVGRLEEVVGVEVRGERIDVLLRRPRTGLPRVMEAAVAAGRRVVAVDARPLVRDDDLDETAES